MSKEYKDFDELYEKYCEELKKWSGGLVETNKSEFLKMYSFYYTVDHPFIQQLVNAYLDK